MDQSELFPRQAFAEQIDLKGFGELSYYPAWLSEVESAQFFEQLLNEVHWEQPTIKIYGVERKIPRLQAWYGDQGAHMTYSETRFDPSVWTPLLLTLKKKLESAFSTKFNSALVNLYRDGNDSVSWHADDEPELGSQPVIASLSLGCARVFRLRPKSPKKENHALGEIQMTLKAGDLVIMKGKTQDYWHHAILKEKGVEDARINLTYRLVAHEV